MPDGVYPELSYGEPPSERPIVIINMVATIDGKTVSGGRDEAVGDLGSRTDHATMRQIEASADAVLVGAGNLRATPGMWFPPSVLRFVATLSGRVDFGTRFFSDDPHRAYVVTTESGGKGAPDGAQVIKAGTDTVDWAVALGDMRHKLGVRVLLSEGGSELNAALFHEGLVDELFLTVAPKIKLGRQTPTFAGGEPFSREQIEQYSLLSCLPVGDEVFLRYRRSRTH